MQRGLLASKRRPDPIWQLACTGSSKPLDHYGGSLLSDYEHGNFFVPSFLHVWLARDAAMDLLKAFYRVSAGRHPCMRAITWRSGYLLLARMLSPRAAVARGVMKGRRTRIRLPVWLTLS